MLDLRETERRFVLLGHDAAILAACQLATLAIVGAASAAPLLTPVWLGVAVAGLYATEQYALRPHHDRALELAVAVATAVTLAVALVLGLGLPAVLGVFMAWAAAGMALPAGRRLVESWLSGPAVRQRWLLFGTATEAREAHEELRGHPLSGRRAVGLVLSRGYLPQPFPLLVVGGPGHLARATAEWSTDGVVVGLEALQASTWRRTLPPATRLVDVPTLCARLSGRVPVRRVDERWFVEHFRWRRGWVFKGAKRATDLGVATLALAAFAPVMAIAAIALVLEGGPVIDVQPHLGRRGRPFALSAFRTVDARGHETRVGRLLRASRLCKLPHLFAVLSGHMALVGPSPHPVELGAELAAYLPHYARRHLVKPGLTGWAQVRDPFGPPLREPERVLGFDLFYVQRRSLSLDAVILIRSLFVGLARLTAARS
ncbi:MAG: sugar transferase [Candidatus Sericytochromatia bacterium]